MRLSIRCIAGVLLTGLVVTSYALPTLLITFDQLVTALERGENVKAIIHLDRCVINKHSDSKLDNGDLLNASTRFNFNTYLHDKIRVNGHLEDTVTTSMTNLNEYSSGDFLNIYSRLRIFANNTAQLYVASYDPVTNEKKLSITWDCTLNSENENNLNPNNVNNVNNINNENAGAIFLLNVGF